MKKKIKKKKQARLCWAWKAKPNIYPINKGLLRVSF
jgi:hypothetical protein